MSLRLKFWLAVAAALALALLSFMHPYVGGHGYTDMWVWRLELVELVLAGLVVFGCGMPLYVESARRLDAAALLCVIAAAAYAYGVLAVLAPGLFPPRMHGMTGVSPHFEASAVVIAVALWRRLRLDLNQRPAAPISQASSGD